MTTNTEERIERNLAKIDAWNGEDINDIIDAIDVLRAYGVAFEYNNPKDIPTEYNDMVAVSDVYAIDSTGNILYTNGSIGSVEKIRQRANREEKGYALFDDLKDRIDVMKENYAQWMKDEKDKMDEKGRSRSTTYARYTEALEVLENLSKDMDAAIAATK